MVIFFFFFFFFLKLRFEKLKPVIAIYKLEVKIWNVAFTLRVRFEINTILKTHCVVRLSNNRLTPISCFIIDGVV